MAKTKDGVAEKEATPIVKTESGNCKDGKSRTSVACRLNSTFESADELKELVDAYFAECKSEGKLAGEADLCVYLSRHNKKGRTVNLESLRHWCDGIDGKSVEGLQDAAKWAYMLLASDLETNPLYREKGMPTVAIFKAKQQRLLGYTDRVDTKQDTTVRIVHGSSIDSSDFE